MYTRYLKFSLHLAICILISACSNLRQGSGLDAQETTPIPFVFTTQGSGLDAVVATTFPSASAIPQIITQVDEQPAISNPAAGRVREADGADQILIPSGSFWMGCDPDHNGGFACNPDEKPVHEVILTDYYIDKFEVTNGQYALCVQDGDCVEPTFIYSATRSSYYDSPEFDRFPVIAVTWYEASVYCEWAGGHLPTEAEWEKAARGGSVQAYPWGDENPSCELANLFNDATGKDCIGDTIEVGSYPEGVSFYGVMDMAGNVWEWVSDWYSPDHYSADLSDNPTGPEMGFNKVIRGGAWDYSWSRNRTAYNSDHLPEERELTFGFRCAQEPNW